MNTKLQTTAIFTLMIGLLLALVAVLINEATLPQVVSMFDISNFAGAAGDHQVVRFGSNFITHDQSGVQEIARAGEMLQKAMGCEIVSIQYGVVECVK